MEFTALSDSEQALIEGTAERAVELDELFSLRRENADLQARDAIFFNY